MQYMIGKSIGGLVSGQLVEHTGLTVQNLFFVQAGITCGGVTVIYIIYWTIGRKLEQQLLAEIEQKEQDNVSINTLSSDISTEVKTKL